ncbi:MAG: LysM peptidoglycan-binding domain-containing protein, partial [Anaerolineaceae bacterium]|nr:LysM peptidoglycan-binding domain-containing protein [Anaerolineaceae bacterium]
CNTNNDASQTDCANCGADLTRVMPWQEGVGNYGPESNDLADLAESRLRWRSGTCLTLIALAMAATLCAGVLLQLAIWLLAGSSVAVAPTAAFQMPPTSVPTDTPVPTLYLPTVTSTPVPPPTETATPTRAPCLQEVRSGDSLIAVVTRCGHRDLDVLERVLEENDLTSAELLQAGQQLVIPWPTETPGAIVAASAPGQGGIAGNAGDESPVSAARPFSGVSGRPEPTLQPGVMWHQVRSGETIVGIAFRFGTDLKVLSELNPEVTFSQCDFGQASGGPSCVVTIYDGQQLRVPAPTPTPTQSPTPSGLPGATPTTTVNVPVAFSPPDNRNFNGDELVTLRWVAPGSLSPGETWRVVVDSLSSGWTYTETTTSLNLILPAAWKETQPGWHGYRWRVQLLRSDGEVLESDARQFLWETGA